MASNVPKCGLSAVPTPKDDKGVAEREDRLEHRLGFFAD